MAIVALDLQCFKTQFFEWNSGTSEVKNGKNENHEKYEIKNDSKTYVEMLTFHMMLS